MVGTDFERNMDDCQRCILLLWSLQGLHFEKDHAVGSRGKHATSNPSLAEIPPSSHHSTVLWLHPVLGGLCRVLSYNAVGMAGQDVLSVLVPTR